MKTTTNITNTVWDLERYRDGADVEKFLDEFALDGLEVMPYGSLTLSFLPENRVTGIHLGYFPCWVDFYSGNTAGVLSEYGTLEEAHAHFGGDSPEAIERFFAEQLDFAERVHAEYVVFHVSDVSLAESVSYRFVHTHRQVIDETVRLLNRILDKNRHSFAFLMENQWWPGLTFLNPDEELRLLDGIDYPNAGFLVDTGHLFHTNLGLRSEDEAIDWSMEALSKNSRLLKSIRAVHLHQSLTGDFVKKMIANPPEIRGSYRERLGSVYEQILGIDLHRPFCSGRVKELIGFLNPEYLTHEFITVDRKQHEEFLKTQIKALAL